MAAVSGKVTRGASGMNSSSNRAEPGMWNFAVPMNEESFTNSDRDVHDDSTNDQRQTPNNQSNESTRPTLRKNTMSNQDLDSAYAASEPGTHLQTEMHRQGRDKIKTLSRDKSRSRVRRKGSLGALSALENLDNVVVEMTDVNGEVSSQWIHRDKLAAIESKELAEMGFRVSARPSRAGSRMGKKSSKSSSIDLGDDYQYEDAREYEHDGRDEKLQRIASPLQPPDSPIREEADEMEEYSHPVNEDFVAAQPASQPQLYKRPRKQSQSKIPVSKPSTPGDSVSPTNHITDDTATASPTGYGGYRGHRVQNSSTSNINMQRPGSSDQSQRKGSTPGLEAANQALQNIQKDNSPKKTSPGGQTRNGRINTKASPDLSRPKTAGSSSSGGTKRPGSGNELKESTPRPEGDPPWLESMYKPDPRLPPDQQMLPTHAKRLAQERAEKERRDREDKLRRERQEAEAEKERFSEMNRRATEEPPLRNEDYTLLDAEDSEVSENERLRNAYQLRSQTSGLKEQPSNISPLRQETQPIPGEGKENQDPLQNVEWPLATPSPKDELPPPGPASSSSPTKERSGTPEVKGYNIMPVVHTQQELEQRAASRTGQTLPSGLRTSSNAPSTGSALAERKASNTRRLPSPPEVDEKDKEKGGCACCTIM